MTGNPFILRFTSAITVFSSLFLYDSFKRAVVQTYAAFNAFILIDDVKLFDFAGNGSDGTVSGAFRAAFARVGNLVTHELLTYSRGTCFILDVSYVFVSEISQS